MLIGSYKFYKNSIYAGCTENLILDDGLGIFGTAIQRNRCSLGSGSIAPTPVDTQLENELLETTNIVDDFFSYRDNPFSVTHAFVYQFTVPEGGIEFTEVGVGQQTKLLSRALTRDGNGRLSPIGINSDENLRVIHSIKYVPSVDTRSFVTPLEGVDGTIVDHIFDVRSCEVGSQSVWRSVCGNTWVTSATLYEELTLSDPSTTPVGGGQSETFTYTGSMAVNSDSGLQYLIQCGIDEGALVNGIGGIIFQTGGSGLVNTSANGISGKFQVKISPPIVKTIDDKLTLRFDLGF